ncbi:DUF4232 domain-containing protein [Streptomyces sp. NPDC057675]|uniref:DUF4232 domain-containing protein n=1 Tax=Streptomyces sp. NPDC057675 TaxID=3346204 RepID=UPI003683A014
MGCQESESAGTGNDASASATTSSASSPSNEATSPSNGAPSGAPSHTTPAGGAEPSASEKPDEAATGDAVAGCDESRLQYTLVPVARPVNHMVLEAKNSGSAPCRMPDEHPTLTFYLAKTGETGAQSGPADGNDRHQVTIRPGESAYAGVMTYRGDVAESDGLDVSELGVGLTSDDAGKPMKIDTITVAEPTVTGWYGDFDAALDAS